MTYLDLPTNERPICPVPKPAARKWAVIMRKGKKLRRKPQRDKTR